MKQRLGATQNGLVIGISLNYFGRTFHSFKGQKTVVSNNLLDLKTIFIACAKLISEEKPHDIGKVIHTKQSSFCGEKRLSKEHFDLMFFFSFPREVKSLVTSSSVR